MPSIVRITRPTRPDKARRLGYKAKQNHKQAKYFLTNPLVHEDDLDELLEAAFAADGETCRSSEPDTDGVPLKQRRPKWVPLTFD
ncbi:hypothetical protein Taro_012588 [Colocasia esculenta]|uniref:Ribosomal protein L15 n=1 Tax=Colocasia esculenta TaxID=4460 RepID=A0A843UDY6_COLES|nr:hypothetical protein [Colocasia esculenta]